MNELEYRNLKSKYLQVAEKNIENFIASNTAVLNQYIELVLRNIKNRNTNDIKEYSYQLFSIANSFGRDDVSRISEIIHKSILNEKFATNKPLLDVFYNALFQLKNLNKPKKQIYFIH
mgnify:CR=1 FL=1